MDDITLVVEALESIAAAIRMAAFCIFVIAARLLFK